MVNDVIFENLFVCLFFFTTQMKTRSQHNTARQLLIFKHSFIIKSVGCFSLRTLPSFCFEAISHYFTFPEAFELNKFHFFPTPHLKKDHTRFPPAIISPCPFCKFHFDVKPRVTSRPPKHDDPLLKEFHLTVNLSDISFTFPNVKAA